MTESGDNAADRADRAFATLQRLLPQHLLSKTMYRLARSTHPALRNLLIRSLLRAYPAIDMTEAEQPDPYRYASFNAFFTRALRRAVRPVDDAPDSLVSPVDGTLSQYGVIDRGQMLQAKGLAYSAATLLDDAEAAARFDAGHYACIYLAPYDYHRIHVPLAGRLTGTRYVPGKLFSVNAATARTIPGLFGRNERAVCTFDTVHGPLAVVMVGALLVGSIATVPAGEVNPPPTRGGVARDIADGIGRSFAKGDELGRFNMGSTVVVLWRTGPSRFDPRLGVGCKLRMGQPLARLAVTDG